MKEEMVRKYKINPDDIQAEPYSIDTSENAMFGERILKTLGFEEFEEGNNKKDKPVYLITSQFHLDRATFLFNQYFNGNLTPLDAEQILIDFVQKFSDGKTKNPYKKVVEKFKASLENKKLTEKDKILNMIEASPLGEELLRALAYYLRNLNGNKEEIPSVKQRRENN